MRSKQKLADDSRHKLWQLPGGMNLAPATICVSQEQFDFWLANGAIDEDGNLLGNFASERIKRLEVINYHPHIAEE